MNIPSNFIRESSKLLSRIRHPRTTLPVLTHILATLDSTGITLAITDLDRWLETRMDASPGPNEPESFLIPPDAMKAMKQADKNTDIKITCKGPSKRRELRLVMTCGGISVESRHPTLEASDFPLRPVIDGEEIRVPSKTMESLTVIADCASNDATRYVLSGVLFTPEDGGRLVATDGRRLASAPAEVPPTLFILPNQSVSVLAHPDFTGNEAHVRLQKLDETEWISIRSGNHLLMSKTIEGTYPNYRQVIPHHAPELVTFSPDHRTSVIKWLRGLADHESAVNLSWEKKGHLTLAQRSASDASAVLRVPAEIEGSPPLSAFLPRYLADAFEIGSTLCLSDELSPGICRHPSGRFCVVMPMRVNVANAAAVQAEAVAAA
ncbi:MAG: DNA polymerase III subunit beta [Luteolibacter sp.]